MTILIISSHYHAMFGGVADHGYCLSNVMPTMWRHDIHDRHMEMKGPLCHAATVK